MEKVSDDQTACVDLWGFEVAQHGVLSIASPHNTSPSGRTGIALAGEQVGNLRFSGEARDAAFRACGQIETTDTLESGEDAS